jgi:hypothetical protein
MGQDNAESWLQRLALKLICLFVLMFCSHAVSAQSLQVVRTVPIQKPVQVSLDRNGNIYISDEKGNINKYDSLGTPLTTFSPQKLGVPTMLESWYTLKIFAFYRDFQEFVLLDRFLNFTPNYKFRSDAIGFVRMATMAADFNLWVVDDADFSLKKYSPQQHEVLFQTSFDLLLGLQDYDINFMREYQNNLYINDHNSGILVFDNMGNYKKKLPFKGLTQFNFLNDELYYLQDNKISFFNLYNFKEKSISLPQEIKARFVLINRHSIALFDNSSMYLLKIKN